MRHGRGVGACALTIGLGCLSPATAMATPPGANGLIAWQHQGQAAPPQLWVAAPDGTGAHAVLAQEGAATFEPAFSPVAPGLLAFTRATQPFTEEIVIGDLGTGSLRQVTDSPGASVAPAFSPDGSRIAFFSVRPPGRHRPPGLERIATIGADGTGLRLLTPANRSSTDPDFSPDGRRIVYTENRLTGRFGDNRLMTMRADGTHRRPLTRYGGRREVNAKWLPDGSGVVFESMDRRSRRSDVERIGANGRGRRTILDTRAFETNPVPSPDGTRIVFTSDRDRRGPTRLGPGFEVYTARLDGTDVVRLTHDKEPDVFPDWQRVPAP